MNQKLQSTEIIDPRILCIGDSITRGVPGVSFVRLLQKKFPEYRFINHGIGGDTLIGVGNRLILELDKTPDYDLIIFEAGHNDILLPTFRSKSRFWRESYRYLTNRGSIPIEEPDLFAEQLTLIISQIRKQTVTPLCITTLSCLTENPDNPLNILRGRYNKNIRMVAQKTECSLADIGDVFDDYLNENPGTNRFLGNIMQTAILDQISSMTTLC